MLVFPVVSLVDDLDLSAVYSPSFISTGFPELSPVLSCGSLHCLHQLLNKDSLVTTMVVINLITGDGQLSIPIHYC